MTRAAEILLSTFPDVNFDEALDEEGNGALHLAVKAQDRSMVAVLVHKGFDPAVTDNEGQTPLDVAIQNNDRSMARVVIRAQLRADTWDDDMVETSMKLAARLNRLQILKLLLSTWEDNGSALMEAIEFSNMDVVRLLREGNSHQNVQSWYDAVENGVVLAARIGRGEALQDLISVASSQWSGPESGTLNRALRSARDADHTWCCNILRNQMYPGRLICGG